jgi:cell division septum initiation protein DivIVA
VDADVAKQFFETARLIGRLVDAAAAPARREATALSCEAPPARARRALARRQVKAAESRAARLAWLPLVGNAASRAAAAARAALESADAAWEGITSRAETAAGLMASARAARAEVVRSEARARRSGPVPPGLPERVAALLARVRFVADTDGRDASRAGRLAHRTFALAREAAALADAWDGAPLPPIPQPAAMEQPQRHNVPAVSLPHRRTQMALDFDGTGQTVDEQRIWLPVSASRTREMVERGARVDRNAPRRGSQLWIPVSERQRFAAFLPLAFRPQTPKFSFPPIRHGAAGQNLWTVFDRSSWNHVRTTAYDRAGHRCQVCGRQFGGLWTRITPAEDRAKSGPVDCHEVWDWEVTDPAGGVGIQRLKRLLVLCKDCHGAFHAGHTLWRAREAGLGAEADDYIKARRMLLTRSDGATLEAQLADDREAWEENKGVVAWVIDLSHLAAQDFMADHTLVLQENNRAGVGAALIGGIAFRTEDGTAFGATAADALASGQPPRPLARPVSAWT